MAIEKYIATKNIANVIEDENTLTTIDVGTASAYEDSVAAAQHVEEVVNELDKAAETVVSEEPETPEVKQDNIYTKKATLDESIDDFNISKTTAKRFAEEDDEDEYLDYDMFDFVYGLAVDGWPRPKNPLDHPIKTFQYTGTDDYMKTNSNVGTSQVSSDINGNVVVYGDTVDRFDDIQAVADYYHIRHTKPQKSMSAKSHWNYSLTLIVPTTADGYPMMVEDFFEQYGLTVADVIQDHKVSGKAANWGNTYAKNAEKDRKNAQKMVNDDLVNQIFEKHRIRCANSNEPVENFLSDLLNELDKNNLEYSKAKIKKQFNDLFNDDFEDEE